jgi:uncharacterized protein (DUF427 family)
MPVRHEFIGKWVRGYVGSSAVVDTRAPMLFWEENFPVPHYSFATEDVRTDLLVPSVDAHPQQPFFFLPQGPVTTWYDLVLDGRRIPFAAWVRDDPVLVDRIIFSWQPGLLHWLEEDEEVAGHPRDPHKRVEAIASSRRVTVAVDGKVLAESARPVLLFETDLPTRYYLPAEDVNLSELSASPNKSLCPYKGTADRYWNLIGNEELRNVAWSYSHPFPAVGKVAGLISFYNELVDITVDGVPQHRPVSPFSAAANRPTA